MKSSERVPPIELCRKLVELKIEIKTGRIWLGSKLNENWFVTHWDGLGSDLYNWTNPNHMSFNTIPAPDATELMELLPCVLVEDELEFLLVVRKTDETPFRYCVEYVSTFADCMFFRYLSENLSEALIQNLIEVKKHNG